MLIPGMTGNSRTALTLVKSECTAVAIVSQHNHVTSNFGKSLEYAIWSLSNP